MEIAVVAVMWGCLCAALAWRYPRATAEAVGPAFSRALRDELADAHSDAERMAIANVLLADVERDLNAHVGTPKVAGWLALLGVALLVVVGALVRPEPVLAVGVVGAAIGVAGAVVARRVGGRGAERARARADEHVRGVVGELYDAEIVLPVRSKRRFRAR